MSTGLDGRIDLPVLVPTEVDTPGTLPGSFAVLADGSASYSIPLQLPPGRAGIEPQLELRYSSAGPDGYLGTGWSLSGFSSIGRCAQTIAQDGAAQRIMYTASDRFCLDGARLVAVPGTGAYSQDGTLYHTELDSFVRVRSFAEASDPTQPARFEVRRRDGRETAFRAAAAGLLSRAMPRVANTSCWTPTQTARSTCSFVRERESHQRPTRGARTVHSMWELYLNDHIDGFATTPTRRAGGPECDNASAIDIDGMAGRRLVGNLSYRIGGAPYPPRVKLRAAAGRA